MIILRVDPRERGAVHENHTHRPNTPQRTHTCAYPSARTDRTARLAQSAGCAGRQKQPRTMSCAAGRPSPFNASLRCLE